MSSSSSRVTALRKCPECNGTGREQLCGLDMKCDWCAGEGYCSHARAAQWELTQAHKPKLPDYDHLEDTLPESER